MKFSKASIYSEKNIYLKINKNHWQNKKKRGGKKKPFGDTWKRHRKIAHVHKQDVSRAQTWHGNSRGKWCDSTHSIVWEWVVTKLLFDFLFHFYWHFHWNTKSLFNNNNNLLFSLIFYNLLFNFLLIFRGRSHFFLIN